MEKKRADLAVQYTDAVNQYGPNYPKVQRLQAQMKEVDDQMSRERKGIVAQLESEYREAKQHEELLSRALDQQKAEVNAMSEKMIQYNILKREAEANKVAVRQFADKAERSGDFLRAEVLEYSHRGPRDDSFDAVAAGQDAEYCARVSRRTRRWNRSRASPRVSGQHRKDSR